MTPRQAPHVAILGAGRMGSAMAVRLSDDFPVVTWSRSGATVAGLDSAPSAAAAVKDADVVLLALYDAAACRAVLAGCLGDLSPGSVVVNTATVGATEAQELEDLVRGSGHGYLHAPVMGSVPAVLAGRLTVLAGGTADDRARAVLSALGDVVELEGAGTAAALKLVVIGVLGDCLVDVRTALDRGRSAGLRLDPVLSALERSPLGGLVSSKRDRLLAADGSDQDTEFAVGALAKDLSLLASLTGRPHRASATIEHLRFQGVLSDDDDVASVCVVAPGAQSRRRTFPDARLTVRDDVDVPDDLLAPLHAYALGHATGSADHFRRAFLPTAHIEGVRDGAFQSWDLPTYCDRFAGPAPDEHRRRRYVDDVQPTGSVATARMTLLHGDDRFTDLFLLVDGPDGWRIANKVYHRG